MRQAQTSLYQDTITPLNAGYRDLMYHYTMHDFKAGYLKAYAFLLSPNLPDQTIWQMQEYRELEAINPLPDDGDEMVTQSVFENYMMVFENISRKVGLMDKDPMPVESESDIDLVVMGGSR